MGDAVRRMGRGAARAALVGILLGGGLGLGGVAQARPAADKVTISYWQQWTDPVQKASMMKVIASFEKANPSINVKEVDISGDQKILTAITGGTPPDVASVWNPNDMGDWAARGAIQDLTSLVASTHTNLSDYTKASLGFSSYKGHLYGLPIEQDGYALFINQDAFKAAGIKSYPATTSELAADAVKLTKKDSAGRITQLGLAGTSVTQTYPYFNGTWYSAGTNKVTPDSAGNLQALTWEQSIVNKIGVQAYENFVNAKARNPIGDAWIDGSEAMAIDGDWMCALTPAYNKTLHWTVAPPPYVDGHPEWKQGTIIAGAINVIPRGASHPAEAFTFARFLGTTDAQVSFNTVIGNTPVTKSAGARMNHGCLGTFIKLENGPRAFDWPVLPVSNQYATAVTTAEDQVLRGKASAQQGFANVRQTIQSALASMH